MKIVVLLPLILAANLCFSQSVIYVKASANGTNNGTSWANAFTDLQLGLEAATAGDEIWVAQGIYYPSKDTNNQIHGFYPRRKSFTLLEGVGLYGGFNGTETQRNQRNWRQNITVLSGDLGVPNDNSDNTYEVVYAYQPMFAPQAVLDGFFITGGNADNVNMAFRGGGIFINGPGPVLLKNLVVYNNYGKYGGGVAIRAQGTTQGPFNTVVANCVIKGNTAELGGGIYLHNRKTEFYNCSITNNVATLGGNGGGGGIFANISSCFLYHCTLSTNISAGPGHSISNYRNHVFHILNSIVDSTIYTYLRSSSFLQYQTYKNSIIWGSGGSSSWKTSFKGIDLGGNLDTTPHFVAYNIPRLKFNSPAKDAGSNADIPADIPDLDNDGDTTEPLPLDGLYSHRIYNSTVDMGAHEYAPVWIDTLHHVICEDSTYDYNGKTLNKPGIYYRTAKEHPAGDTAEYLVLTMDSINTTIYIDAGGTYVSLEDSAEYWWVDCSNTDTVPGAFGQTFTPTQNGNYAVYIRNSLGCTKYSQCLKINNVGLKETVTENRLTLYPNPVNDILIIRNDQPESNARHLVKIYNVAGQEVFRKTIGNESVGSINLQALAPGSYTLEVAGQVLKFVKK